MTILKETTGSVMACDGCGRTDAGPNQVLHIQSYTVNDPNIGSAVQHHYCAGCAANRGITDTAVTIVGWEASAPPVTTSDVSQSDPAQPA